MMFLCVCVCVRGDVPGELIWYIRVRDICVYLEVGIGEWKELRSPRHQVANSHGTW